jgi:hypothetical protein
MTIGTSLLLVAIGAILKWAVTAHVSGFDVQAAGTVIFVIGLVGLPVALLYTFYWSTRGRRAIGQPPAPPLL